MKSFLTGVLFSGIGFFIFYMLYLFPNLSNQEMVERALKERYLQNIKEAEMIINDNLTACELNVADAKKAQNKICNRFSIKNCVIPETVIYPRYFYNVEENKWFFGDNRNGFGAAN